MAPNAITLMGLIVPVMACIHLFQFDLTMTQVVPPSVWYLGAFAVFWYQTLDAVDGKQARRTNNCSPLGQLLDHNLDQVSHIFFCIIIIALFRGGDNFMMMLVIMLG